jgi:hypothetical protein
MMRLAFKICMSVLLLAGVAESQEPMTPAVQMPPRPRPHRVVRPQIRPQTHLDDPWYPDPAPTDGSSGQPSPAPQPAAITSGSAPAVTPAPQPAPVQQRVEEQLPPPTPPEVAYRDGLLTVRAINSTLESVLTAIRNKAGIQFEGLESAPERVVISMGPLPEGEVLATILGGSRFDYIAVDRPDSPGIVQRVLLTARRGASATGQASSATQPPAQRMGTGEEEENPEESSAEPESPQDTPARPPIMQAQPQMQINPQPNQPQPNQQPTGPKTPEQLLEELKQMQQRQQQQQPQDAPLPRKPPR